MNVGLREGRDVAMRVAEILRGGDSRALAGSYDAERRKEWGRLLGREGELSCSQETSPWLSKHRQTILSCLPASGHDLEQLLDQAGLRLT
jgi:hypothetical protein